WHWPGRSVHRVRKWIWSAAAPSLVAGLLTAVYIVGKNIGPDALSKTDPYRPRFSWHQYYWTTVKYINEIFYHDFYSWVGILILFPILAIIAVAAWRLKQKSILWAV